MKLRKYNSQDIEWDKEPKSFKVEEYFKFFDMGNLSGNVASDKSSALYIMAFNDLKKAVENDITDEEGELVLFDPSKFGKGTFSAYIIPYDMPEISMQSGDYAILDLSKKHFDGDGYYALNTSGTLRIAFVPTSDDTDFLIIEAKVCEIRRKL